MYYIFNCNNKNEYLDSVDEEYDPQLSGTATTVPYVSSQVPYKSYAYNIQLSSWYDLIDDYRGTTLYFVNDSRISKVSRSLDLEINWTPIAPPDLQNFYKFNGTQWIKQNIVSKQSLMEKIYKSKCDTAYTGIIMSVSGSNYLFETDEKSITLCNSTFIQFTTPGASIDGDVATVNWKSYKDGVPTLVTLTANQFCNIFTFGLRMINEAFGVEGALNKQVESITEEQLKDDAFVKNFYSHIDEEFEKINKIITVS